MKICIAGKNNIAVNVCSYLLNKYPTISVIVVKNRTDNGVNGFQRSFWKFANDNNLPVVSLEDTYSIPDLIFLSLEFDRIIYPEKFFSNKLFNIHFSLLPAYKGMYTSALPILHAEERSGVTLHKIDSGIDTGDILCQKEILLSPSETAGSLYKKYIEAGTSLVIEHIDSILSDTYTVAPQCSERSSYFSKQSLNYSDLQLNLNVTAFQLSSQIRAFNFRDYQLPELYGCNVVGTYITNERSMVRPGQILEENRDYIVLSTIDYNIRVYKDRFCDLLEYCRLNDLHGLQQIPQLGQYLFESEQIRGWTLLMVAAYNNSIDVCKYLIEQGAYINARNFNGTTVLMYAKDAALRMKDYSLIDLFLQNGADPLLEDYSGKTLFDYLKTQSITLLEYIKERWLNS